MMSADLRRCNLFLNRDPSNQSKVLHISSEAGLDHLLALASSRLHCTASRVFFENGAEIKDVAIVRDNETIYVSEGEEFQAGEMFQASKPQEDVTIPISVIGSGSVGKSAITLRWAQGLFLGDYDPTIEDAYRKNIVLPDGQLAIVDVLDTAGQEEYTALRSNWCRDREGFLLVFSVADRSTFELLGSFIEHINEVFEDDSVPIILVGNKIDLKDQRQVSFDEAKLLAEEFKLAAYIETSAKTGLSVDEAFLSLIRHVRDRSRDKRRKQELLSDRSIFSWLFRCFHPS